ncbi:TIGR02206 family membrane protein [Corynebacterium singulare]|uniref:TIGR02206 family membrane protein n=1 Tax=Corynebacterium singulare TaxID=161899 RepID=A0ABS9PT78_9CORY|nr:TIGR02206 family membrane protein [Corynebacterium singulare]MCG7275919.1 TIGR02206 family membrane protein [Corynebacterium singulare]
MLRPRRPRVTPTDYERMQQWTPLHALMLTITVAACGVFIVGARRVKGTSREKFVRQMVGWALLVLGTAWTVISLDPKQFDIRESLPLHLCDVLRPILALGLITDNEHALTLTYFWGIILNPQAIITPDVIYYFSPRWLRFATYWFFHIVALAVPLGLTFGLGYRPTWKGYRFAVKVTPVWMAIAMAVNAKTDGNYGFLNHAPGSPSIINLFGPWPGYIAVETLAVMAAWAAMTWPWENTSLRRGTTAVGTRGLLRKSVGTASGILRRVTVRFRK